MVFLIGGYLLEHIPFTLESVGDLLNFVIKRFDTILYPT